MKFGRFPLESCVNAILAHGLSLPTLRLSKGHRLSSADLATCKISGVTSLTVAILDPDDVHEDDAAARVGTMVSQPTVQAGRSRTGRCNLFAAAPGLLDYDSSSLEQFNSLDEGLTLALLPPATPVQSGQLIGTVKIIPFALAGRIMTAAAQLAPSIRLGVRLFEQKSASLLQTTLPGVRQQVLAKTAGVTRERLAAVGIDLHDAGTVAHDEAALTARLKDLKEDIILIVGASAIADRKDIIPASITAAGGIVQRFGIPCDPGNLLCYAERGAQHLIGLPGCARSPKRNGFDLVLERLCVGLPVTGEWLAALGAGGLLDDVPERALPRAEVETGTRHAPRIGAVLLAAGSSRRMGIENKLLLPTGSGPVVRRTAESLRAGGIEDILAVLGHQAETVGQALQGAVHRMIFNPDFAGGMSTSLRAGLLAAPDNWEGAFIMLGDMPLVQPASFEAMCRAFDPRNGQDVIVPTVQGQRGNPVLWARSRWAELLKVQGDTGGRALLASAADAVVEVPLDDTGLLRDVDDAASWQALKPLL